MNEQNYKYLIERGQNLRKEILEAKINLNKWDWKLSFAIPFLVAAFNFWMLYNSYFYHYSDWSMFCGILGSVFSIRILYQYFSHQRFVILQNKILDSHLADIDAATAEYEQSHKTRSDESNSGTP